MTKTTVYVKRAETETAITREMRDAVDGAGFFDKRARSAHLEIAKECVGGYSNSRLTGRYVVRYSYGAKRFVIKCATEAAAFEKADAVWTRLVSWVDASKCEAV